MTAPSHALNDLDTSKLKSACPGVSIRFNKYACPSLGSRCRMLTACAFTVIPRRRSTGSVSRTCLLLPSRFIAPVSSSNRSASVLLPWSTCAMMLKFLVRSRGIAASSSAVGGLSSFSASRADA